MTALQILMIAITVSLNALDGFDVASISFASPGIAKEWGIERGALGIVLSMEVIGMAIGSMLLGGIADKIGRRRTVLGCIDHHGARNVLGTDDAESSSSCRSGAFSRALASAECLPRSTRLPLSFRIQDGGI